MYKKIKLSVVLRGGYDLFKGLCLLFLPNVPGATIIQGGTFIPESRVNISVRAIWEAQASNNEEKN